jgi:hypothetical protein
MLGLFTVSPTFCPMCGEKTDMGKMARDDFYHNASFTCPCGFHYQHAPERIVLEAAELAGGDMKNRAGG